MPPRDFDLDIVTIRRRLQREGWTVRPSKGPHDVYVREGHPGFVTVPRGRGDLAPGTARAIADSAGWRKGRSEP